MFFIPGDSCKWFKIAEGEIFRALASEYAEYKGSFSGLDIILVSRKSI
jgi:hypothetical protein